MLPEQRTLITENQELLYSFRKGGSNLPKRHVTCLPKKISKSFQTIKKSIDELKKNNIILDSDNFLLNPDFAYFVGFYVTDDEVEVELLNFKLEPVLEKIIPDLKNKIHHEHSDDIIRIIVNMIEKISGKVTITATSIIFNKCMSYTNYQESIAYYEDELELKLYKVSLQFNSWRRLMPMSLQTATLGDSVLAYTLYLREKVFESNSIVYYDLDQNRISYIKNNILNIDSNPMFGMIFPRFTREQKELFQKLSIASDNEYSNILMDNKEQVLSAIEHTFVQIKAFLNPEYFIVGGKWIKQKQFEEFIFWNNRFFEEYKYLTNTLFLETSSNSFLNVMNRDEQPQKGAGIYAAYSFFDWELKW